MNLERIVEGIVIGGAGGFFAGLIIWLIQYGRDWYTKRSQKKRVYSWLHERTKQPEGLTVGDLTIPQWISTEEIASYTNLTPENVRYICSNHDKIRLKTKKDLKPKESLEEKWGIRQSVDKLKL